MRTYLMMAAAACLMLTACSGADDNGCIGEYCFDEWESCGDGVCQTEEDCPEDCAPVFCGNGLCDELWNETLENCPEDCENYCGDLICRNLEDEYNCYVDCGPEPLCGDTICELSRGEDDQNCFRDCGCWNGRCDSEQGETELTCYQDCGVCGNGVCARGENAAGPEDEWSCPEDCSPLVECGDLRCDPGESPETCPGDCYCGCSLCDAEDAPPNCQCEWNTCDLNESAETCPTDCAPTCGDGVCDESIDESWLYCPADCRCTDPDFLADCDDGCWPTGTNCASDVHQCDGYPYRCGWPDYRANCCEGIFRSCPDATPYYCSDTDECLDYEGFQACASRDSCTTVNIPCSQ